MTIMTKPSSRDKLVGKKIAVIGGTSGYAIPFLPAAAAAAAFFLPPPPPPQKKKINKPRPCIIARTAKTNMWPE